MAERPDDPFRGARAPAPPAGLRARVMAGIAREIRESERASVSLPTAVDSAVDRLWESGVARLTFAAAVALLVVSHLAIGSQPAPRLPGASLDGADWRAAFTVLRTSDDWERLDGQL